MWSFDSTWVLWTKFRKRCYMHFKAFYQKHFSIILHGKSQTVLTILRGECMTTWNMASWNTASEIWLVVPQAMFSHILTCQHFLTTSVYKLCVSCGYHIIKLFWGNSYTQVAMQTVNWTFVGGFWALTFSCGRLTFLEPEYPILIVAVCFISLSRACFQPLLKA